MEGKSHRANKNTIISKANSLLIFATLTAVILLSYAHMGYAEDGGWETSESYSAPDSGMDMSTIDTPYYLPPTIDTADNIGSGMDMPAPSYMSTSDFSSPISTPDMVVPSLPTFSGSLEEVGAEMMVPSLPTFSSSLEEVVQEIVTPDKSTILSGELEKMPAEPAAPIIQQPQPGIYQVEKNTIIIPPPLKEGSLTFDPKGKPKWSTDPNPQRPPREPNFLEWIFGGDKK